MKITIARLRRWEGQPIDKEKLEGLRSEIYEKTKTNKFAPFSNVKKWIKAARKAIAKGRKEAEKKGKAKPSSSKKDEPMPIPQVSTEVEQGMLELKAEMGQKPITHQEVSMPKPPIVFDKVYLQSMNYEMASMRSALERISKQLDKLDRELQSHGDD
jgi:hypothetical protein